MLDSIYHMTITLKSHFWRKNVFFFYVRRVVMDVITFPVNHKPLVVVYRFYCMALFHSQTRRHMIRLIYLSFIIH